MATTQNKPVPVPSGFKFGPGAVGTVPAKHDPLTEVLASDPVPVVPASILDIPNPEKPKTPKKKKSVAGIVAAVIASSPTSAPVTVPVETPGVPLLGSKGTTYPVHIPPDLLAKIQKPVTGMGGWQRVMLDIKAATVYETPGPPDPVTGLPFAIVTLTPYLLDRLITLAVKHGSGGYQAVIRHLVCLALQQHKAAILGGGQTNGQ